LMATTPASACLVTVTGQDFDLIYHANDTLGDYDTPTLSGDTIYFTPNALLAESLNGAGVATTDSTVTSIELVAHAGFKFDSLSLAEFGDYLLTGSNSSVSVTGQLRAFDASNPISAQSSSSITSTALTSTGSTANDWSGSASITSGWLSGATTVGLSLGNLLTAYTAKGDSGALRATLESNFVGIEVNSIVAPVSLPASGWLLLTGLIGLGAAMGKRDARNIQAYALGGNQ